MTASRPLLPDPAQAMLDVTDPILAAQARAIYGILERAGFRALCVSSEGRVTLPEAVETFVNAHAELRERVDYHEKLARKYLTQRDEVGVKFTEMKRERDFARDTLAIQRKGPPF